VTVAVLDSGVDHVHPDLKGQLVAGCNTYNNNADTSPVCGHGIKVAGVVAAASNNGMGITSLASNTKIMPVLVTGTACSASISSLAGALS
jgi:subtilisin family serine protease